MKSKIIFSVCMTFSAQLALADSAPTHAYSYRVEVPAASMTCDQQAQQLSAIFAQATQAQVTGAYCQGSRTLTDTGAQYGINALVVNYVAAAEVTPVRALLSGDSFEDTPSDLEGLFPTYAACLAEMGKQTSLFETETGLLAIAAHCDHAPAAGDNTYTLVLEGFGEAKHRLYAYALQSTTETSATAGSQVLAAAQNVIVAVGGHVAYTDSSHVFYYAPYAISVFEHEMGIYQDAAQCNEQLSAAQQILSQETIDSFSTFCAQSYGTLYSLTLVASGYYTQDPDTLATRYASYADCMKDKDRVLANAVSNGAKVIGSICRQDIVSEDFLLDLYFAKNY